MQQMKHTVESSMKASVEKNQERITSHLPPPATPPLPTSPPAPSHSHPPVDFPSSYPHSHRRSRSHCHHSGSSRPDKCPVSIHRSPRRQRSARRTHRSSRPRSSSRRRHSTSRPPSRATSITLRSASPRHREEHRRRDDHPPHEPTHSPANLQPATWDHYPQPPIHIQTPSHSPSSMTNTPPTSGNPGANGKTILSLPVPPTLLVGSTTQSHQPLTTPLTTHPQNHSLHSPPTTTLPTTNHADLHNGQALSNLVPLLMFLRDTSPSIFKRAPDMNGLVTSNLPYTILTGCVRPTKSRLPNVFKRPQQ